MPNLEKRLAQLESLIKASGEQPVWIDGKNNNTVRVDVGGRRGESVEFPTTLEAVRWIEKQIDSHAGGIVNFAIDHVADACEESDSLRSLITELLPGPIVISDLAPAMVDRELVWVEKIGPSNHPITLSAEYLPGTLCLAKAPDGETANLRLWLLANLIKTYFGSRHFEQHWKAGSLTDDDRRMFSVCFEVFAWQESGHPMDLLQDFHGLFYQVTGLELTPAESQ